MEYLNRCLLELRTNTLFKFHPRCKRLGLVHICFADDLLIFTRGDVTSVAQVLKCFKKFCFKKFSDVSGLKANNSKSCIYFGGVAGDIREEILHMSGMYIGQLPFKYFGVPLSSQKLTVMQCEPLIRKILARIDCWAAELLSYAGRVQLIQSVLYGMQIYRCQIFILPQKVLQLIQSACRTFLWTGKTTLSKRALVAWDRICTPKYAGGLGLVNMKLWNRAAICKLLWSLAQKKDKIWIRWVHGYYVKEGDVRTMRIHGQSSWVIKKILGTRELSRDTEWMTGQSFSIHRMYKALCGDVPRVEWDKMICSNKAPAKCLFISWLLLQKSLVTCDYLRQIGIQVNQTCCFCGQAEETLDHLFFECSVTGQVWTAVTRWCGIQRQPVAWEHERIYLLSQCKTKSTGPHLYRVVLAVVVYQVWKERNVIRMQNSRSSTQVVIQQCKNLVAWCCLQDLKLSRKLATW